jgi:hypothetical protein
LLARSLDLDASQQARLRELLESQRQQLRQLWADPGVSGTDRVGPTLAIFDRTRDQIRAMLTDEQKKKYPAAAPRELTAPAQADPEHWLRLMQPASGSDVVSVK